MSNEVTEVKQTDHLNLFAPFTGGSSASRDGVEQVKTRKRNASASIHDKPATVSISDAI